MALEGSAKQSVVRGTISYDDVTSDGDDPSCAIAVTGKPSASAERQARRSLRDLQAEVRKAIATFAAGLRHA